MDLGAYAQIENLAGIMKANGIEVPRLRGLRLMAEEEPVSDEDINLLIKNHQLSCCESLCRNGFHINGHWAEFSRRTNQICESLIEYERDEEGRPDYFSPIRIRWEKVHGKKRKAFKYAMKKAKKKVLEQYEMWNKYCGQSGVLYIHCRLGAGNWLYFDGPHVIEAQPWFLDKVEDCFDYTYLDVYAKIREV